MHKNIKLDLPILEMLIESEALTKRQLRPEVDKDVENIYDKDNVKAHKDIVLSLNELYAKKNADYGDSFHESYLEEGMAMPRIRLSDKLNRFKSLTKSGKQEVKDESIRDTLLDLANYAIMTVLEFDRENNK